jgi:hypothetical protein
VADQRPESRLVALLRHRADDIAEVALRHCESEIPHLTGLEGRDRDLGLASIRYVFQLRLDLAVDARDATEAEEAPFRRYHADAAERGIPLDLQLQVTRTAIAAIMRQCWHLAGEDLTDEMLTFSADLTRFHRRLEQIAVEAYCQRLGGRVTERLRRAHAEALLDGEMAPPLVDDELPLSGSYLVLVLPGPSPESAPPLFFLAEDAGVLHTTRDGADVVLVPLHPDGQGIAQKLTLHARDAGRTAAVAVVAGTPDEVPAAYSDALRLLQVRDGLRRPPQLLTPDDALPECLLGADPDTSARLAAKLAPLAEHPELVETLAVFLDADLDRSVTAHRLYVHRRTLTQRLQRIRELTGHDPRSTRGVQVLALALAARRLDRQRPAARPA